MPTLRQVGQMAADLYYQDYKSDDQFFDLEHFFFLLTSEYVKMIKAEATANKKENKVFSGFSYIEVSPYWLKTTEVDVTIQNDRAFAELPEPVFQFDYDAVGSAIQNVEAIDCGKSTPCNEVIRIPYIDRWMACAMPPNGKIYYYLLGNKLNFLNVKCNLGKVEVSYVPGPECLTPDFIIHQDKVHDIVRTTLNTMFGAKQGNITDMNSDSNPNTSPATDFNQIAIPNR